MLKLGWRQPITQLLVVLDILALLSSCLLHLSTFFPSSAVPDVWVLLPMALFMASVVLRRVLRWLKTPIASWGGENAWRPQNIIGIGLFLYAVVTFIYAWHVTSGATGAMIENDTYVSLYKGTVSRIITRDHFLQFSHLLMRELSVWTGMLAWFNLIE